MLISANGHPQVLYFPTWLCLPLYANRISNILSFPSTHSPLLSSNPFQADDLISPTQWGEETSEYSHLQSLNRPHLDLIIYPIIVGEFPISGSFPVNWNLLKSLLFRGKKKKITSCKLHPPFMLRTLSHPLISHSKWFHSLWFHTQ